MRGVDRCEGVPLPFWGRIFYSMCPMEKALRIVIATRNKNKLAELKRILADVPVRLEGLDEHPGCPEVEETGETFVENACLKASQVAKCAGLHAIADDSGLEVDALGGAPGGFSARYAGPGANDRKNMEKLLHELEGVPAGKRTARFRAVIALAAPDGHIIETFQGRAEGTIGFRPEGENGFGYDPLFYPLGHESTFAQMGPARKDAMSHRGEALRLLKQFLMSKIPSLLKL